MKPNFKTIIWVIVFIMVVSSFLVFADTLALFESNGTGKAGMDIGAWVIKISNVDITSNNAQEIVIDRFIYENSLNVASGKIAPGTSAYFDLVIDATGCDVAVKYDITFNFDDIDYTDNVSFSVVERDGNSTIQTGENTYSGVIDLETIENEEVVTLRVTVRWDNIEAYNENDTVLGTTRDSRLALPLTVIATQYLGEEITPYTPPVVDTNSTIDTNQTNNG